jgi:NAD(P)-dependent dehydrogenase (short-subunit alcohol dehydrogenase family)
MQKSSVASCLPSARAPLPTLPKSQKPRQTLPCQTSMAAAASSASSFSDTVWWTPDTVAVVTGANKGIGLEIAKGFAREGLTMVVTARDRQLGEAAAGLVAAAASGEGIPRLEVAEVVGSTCNTDPLAPAFGTGFLDSCVRMPPPCMPKPSACPLRLLLHLRHLILGSAVMMFEEERKLACFLAILSSIRLFACMGGCASARGALASSIVIRQRHAHLMLHVFSGTNKILFHQLDISDPVSVNAFAAWAKAQLPDQDGRGCIDILVNNAGFAYKGDAFGAAEAEVTLGINLNGTVRVTRALLPLLKVRGVR